MDALVQIAHPFLPCDPPTFQVGSESVTFFPDPDGSASWLAEVTEEQAEYFLRVPAFTRWLPAPPAAPVPDKTWSIMGIVAHAQEKFGLTLDPKIGKAALIAAVTAAAQAPATQASDAPAAPADEPNPALTAIKAAEAALLAAESSIS